MHFHPTTRRRIAIFLLGQTVFNLVNPAVSYALTGGPAQPEFSSFEPVSTSKMVDEFSGDFSYNLPVLNVPGPNGSDYPLSLSYHSGTTPEEEASWVGYGWTLNAGAISRNTRGFPDDFHDQNVTFWNKAPRNWTVTTGTGFGVELFGLDVGVNASLRYNNYMGFGYNAGLGIPLGKGVVSLGYNVSDGEGSFSLSVSPGALLSQNDGLQKEAAAKTVERYGKAPGKLPSTRLGRTTLLGGNHAPLSFAEAVRPTHVSSYRGQAYNISVGLQGIPAWVPIGGTLNLTGSYSFQENESSHTTKAVGYMYSADNNGNLQQDYVSDYYVEKETPYNKRDLFLGVPFNNADNFAVSGEGIGGGFRLYHKKVGEFRPNKTSSKTLIFNIAGESAVGTTFGIGGDVGAGEQTLDEKAWDGDWDDYEFSNPLDPANEVNNQNEEVFFRFANDLGGTRQPVATQSDDPVSATLDASYRLSYPARRTNLVNERNYSAKGGRSSYIDYHTIPVVNAASNNSVAASLHPAAFSHRPDLSSLKNGLGGSPGAIYEMAVYPANGGEYIYGYPVLSRQEKNLQYGMQGEEVQAPGGYLVKTSKGDAALPVKAGEDRPGAYANTFLLTETRTADYVDRGLDGPTPDDFGGYTKFAYQKLWGGTGSSAQWYNWRVPYNGLLYQRNSLSDPLDDMGTVASGQKEIVYLQYVQTKTHTAIFTLNSGSQIRVDGIDAGVDNEANGGGPRANFENFRGGKTLKYLKRIDLYANSDLVYPQNIPTPIGGAKPIKSVLFEYSNELCQQLPNAVAQGSSGTTGKLTLRRMWFEYQGITPEKISPYTFSYAYPVQGVTANYPAKYVTGPESVTGGYNFTAGAQNPVYRPSNLDAWGYYQADGVERSANLQPWLNQGTPVPDFDPAAWQLKVITLPTGGQIHVQYEQDDYAYVQDRPVHVMASLLRPDLEGEGTSLLSVFRLDMEKLGLDDQPSLLATKKAIEDYYINGGKKIYFKFLYRLAGDIPSTNPPRLDLPVPTSCNSDFVSGYVSLTGVDVVGNSIQLRLRTTVGEKYMLPGEVCDLFVKTQRAGKLSPAGDCNPVVNGAGQSERTGEQIVRQMVSWWRTVWSPDSRCKQINPELSYFRIPLVKAKKGGGLRVKRLLTYDRGMDGKSVLYGNEYIYKMLDPVTGNAISSGVATTEPASLREENPLVEYMARGNQTLLSKAIYGIDRKQSEGPLGESILPAPSVGYARVVTRNIHSGRSAPGYSVTEYATARQYPVQVKATDLQKRRVYIPFYGLLYTDLTNDEWATQGFSFVLNNMHGQMLRQATYPGTYVSEKYELTARPTSEQVLSYYEPRRLNQDGNTPFQTPVGVVSERGGEPAYTFPGREVDLTIAQKAVQDRMLDINLEIDTDAAVLFGIMLPFATVFPTVSRTEADFYTHTTSKVIRYPAIVKRVVTQQDGITHTTDNVAFDKFSGEPVITKVNDEFKGGYLTESVMASWVHPEFGQRASNERNGMVSGTVKSKGTDTWLDLGTGCSSLASITKGSLLEVVPTTGPEPRPIILYLADEPSFATGLVPVHLVNIPMSTSVVGASNNTPVKVRVRRSGQRNQLTASAGTTTYHNASLAALNLPPMPSPRYGPTNFANDINAWLASVPVGATQAQTATTVLPGTYAGMNIMAFSNKLQGLAGCSSIDPANATISQITLVRQVKGNSLHIVIKSFQISCGGQTRIIQN